MKKDDFSLACDTICGVRFDSDSRFCMECEEYSKALEQKGETKSIRDYQVEATVEQSKLIHGQIKGN